ncbi:hypothetical protein ACX8XN_08590 [Calditrichota bacterium GD2]
MCYNAGNSNDRYKYSSKELETMGSLSKYHYGFREYPVRDSFRSDPEIGRWNRVDPLYFQTPGQSPYNFIANIPVNHYDVAGLLTKNIQSVPLILHFSAVSLLMSPIYLPPPTISLLICNNPSFLKTNLPHEAAL